MPTMEMMPIHFSVTSWKCRQSRPAGCSIDAGLLVRQADAALYPVELAQQLIFLHRTGGGIDRCRAAARCPVAPPRPRTTAPEHRRQTGCAREASSCQILPLPTRLQRHWTGAACAVPPCVLLRRDRFAIGGLPAPGAGAVTALGHALLVDLRDDLAVAGEQRLGRAHLGAERQLAFAPDGWSRICRIPPPCCRFPGRRRR